MRFAENEGQLYYITLVTSNRVPCLSAPDAAKVILSSLEFCRSHRSLEVHAWVIMPDHFHALISLPDGGDMGRVFASLKSWTARQLIDMWERTGQTALLERLRLPEPKPKRHVYRVWGRGVFSADVYSFRMVRQKVRYIHRNPEAAGLVESPAEWLFSDYMWWVSGGEVLLTPDPIPWLLDPVY